MFKIFGLVNLPFPRKKNKFESGGNLKRFPKMVLIILYFNMVLNHFPSIGSAILLPTDLRKLRSIVGLEIIGEVIVGKTRLLTMLMWL